MSNTIRRFKRAKQKEERNEFKLHGKVQKETYRELGNNLCLIGRCRCGSGIHYYLTSRKDTIFNYYCFDCKSTGDVRFPKDGDFFYDSELGNTALDAVVSLQQKFNPDFFRDFTKLVDTEPKSIYANDLHGEYNENHVAGT